ncbi:hypothetical protein [Demequina mangrovi]|uniref:Uncharacterized protein n=1 Tax=Demequina mangrovi TaxID=1043493 RepID=A0A1H7AKF9_9MICO|nr:hypothetical protein [Demequina mangrovi]SEJ62370.1 hypothetical protein SAMN05421637_2447 [Demequina mangrovi]
MSDVPQHDNASAVPEPLPEDLESVAVPAHVRSAPKFGSFIGTGVGAGIIVAAVLAIFLPNSTGVGRFLVFVVLALGLCLLGAVIGGALATGLDRASTASKENR